MSFLLSTALNFYRVVQAENLQRDVVSERTSHGRLFAYHALLSVFCLPNY